MATRALLTARRLGILVSAVIVTAAAPIVSAPGSATAASQTKPVAAAPGLPSGGPAPLGAPARSLPELSNNSPYFHAPFDLVSGSERYVGGEYEYTDFIYDDDAVTYPSDFSRYGGNCGDLVEFRMAAVRGGIAYRFTLNTLLQKDSTIIALAFDSDQNTATGSATLPKDPGQPFPGTDEVLTTWGTGGEWSHWTQSGWLNAPLTVTTDTVANQITVFVPDSVIKPAGDWKATLATGLYDPATGGWLPITSSTKSNIINLGFRFNEGRPVAPSPPSENNVAPDAQQTAALTAGQPTALQHVIHFDWLRQGRAWDNIPTHGLIYRIFASHLASATDDTGNAPSGNAVIDSLGTSGTSPNAVQRTEGKDNSSLIASYLSPLQPYAVYIPSGYRPGTPSKMTFALHGWNLYYWWIDGTFVDDLLGESRDSIVLSPGGRGPSNFFVEDGEEDVFDAWNDLSQHYTLDPSSTVVFGQSMGGYGSYRLATLYPQLFARAIPLIPAGQKGIYVPVVDQGSSTINTWLPNLRNVPIFHIADMASELTFYPGQFQNALGPSVNGMNSMEALKYRYVFRSVVIDHFLMGTDFPELINWLAGARVDDRPFHVTYVRMPSSDYPQDGLVHDHAYWLSNIQLRDNSAYYATGKVDAVSRGFGLQDPTTSTAPSVTSGLDMGNRPYIQAERDWYPAPNAAPQDRVDITATNIASFVIDPAAARIDCQADIEVESDGPVHVSVLGCPSNRLNVHVTSSGSTLPAPAEPTSASTVHTPPQAGLHQGRVPDCAAAAAASVPQPQPVAGITLPCDENSATPPASAALPDP